MKILLIDDHKLFATSFRLICEQFEEIEQINIVSDPFKIDDICFENYDIVLVDINLSNISKESGLDISERILERFPNIKIVILTGYTRSMYKQRAYSMGVSAFIDKNIEPEKLLVILKLVMTGHRYFSDTDNKLELEALTCQEVTILELSRRGNTVEEISESLNISRRTVFNHLNHIYDKLSASNKQEAIYKAEMLGYFMDF